MEHRELKFAAGVRRLKEAPQCACGEENNKKNPQFAPFKDCEGKYGYCHRCDRTFLPESTQEVTYTYTPPPKVKQQFLPEYASNWSMLDSTISDPTPPLQGIRRVTWYYRDIKGRLTSSKSMDYTFPQFKRIKDHHPIHNYTRDSGYYPCLFGEYQLTLFPSATVILLESEKTAAILRMRIRTDDYIFLATAGANGLTDEKISVLKGRTVYICYDCDEAGRQAAQSAYLKLIAIASPRIIDLDSALSDGTDLADLPKAETTLELLEQLPTRDITRVIPQVLIDALRQANRDGLNLTAEIADELAKKYELNIDRLYALYQTIQEQWSAETGISRSPLNERLKHWLSKHYEFRRNVLTGLVSMKPHSPHPVTWQKINTATLWDQMNCDSRSIGRGKKGADITIARASIDNLIESDFVPDFNPLKDYFESLPPWDGVDHIDALAQYVQTDNQDFWRKQFKKALIRSIACSLYGEVNRVVMTLVSESQSIGKSSYLRFLCPTPLRELYKEEPLIHTKDSEIALCENFIWNLEELDNLNRGEISAMKAIISRASVKQRRSYARYEEYMPRIVNFWGSTNKNDFLTDTENTRWLCFNVISVDHNYNNTISGVKNIDINQVWSQAWALYHGKAAFTLTPEEQAIQKRSNEDFEGYPMEKLLISRHFKPMLPQEQGSEFMINSDILKHLNKVVDARIKLVDHNIGRSMKQLGFKPAVRKIDGKTHRGYYVLFTERGWGYDDQKTPTQLTIQPPPKPDEEELPF